MNKDYFAELFVAGVLTDKGWNIYFPKRDRGFDFIIEKKIRGKVVMRPVQVKGKYPTKSKKDRDVYGYIGGLKKLHSDMVLAMPYFKHHGKNGTDLIAYMPASELRHHKRGYRCEPAKYKNSEPSARPKFEKYFNEKGLKLMATKDFK